MSDSTAESTMLAGLGAWDRKVCDVFGLKTFSFQNFLNPKVLSKHITNEIGKKLIL